MLAVGAVIFTVKSLNAECGVSKLSKELSPMTLIMEMDTLSYNELMELSFGHYIQVQKANKHNVRMY